MTTLAMALTGLVVLLLVAVLATALLRTGRLLGRASDTAEQLGGAIGRRGDEEAVHEQVSGANDDLHAVSRMLDR